jgi:CheY-like chemotaxis protein
MPDNNTALLVMDNGVLHQEITTLLNGLGYQVTDTVTVSDVLEHLVTNRYDLLVLGMTLPNLDWRDTVRRLRNTSNASRVMMITQTADKADLRSALSAGVYAVLEHPITPANLSDMIALPRYGMFVLIRGRS